MRRGITASAAIPVALANSTLKAAIGITAAKTVAAAAAVTPLVTFTREIMSPAK